MMPLSCAASSAVAIWPAMDNASFSRIGPRCDEVRERGSIDQFEHECLLGAGILEPVNGGDVGMIQRRQHLRFAFEACQAVSVESELVWQDFQRNVTIQLGVPGTVHLTHGPRAKRLQHLVRPDATAAVER